MASPKRKFNHVAVLLGGWSAEREVSLRSGKACADALESAGYKVTRIDAGRDLAARARPAAPGGLLQCLARALGRGRVRAGPARDPGHPLHPFGRAGLRARHAQGARQGGDAGGRHPGAARQDRVASAGGQGARAAAAVRFEARVGGLQRRRLHRAEGPCPPAPGADRSGLGVRRGSTRRALTSRDRS